MNESPSSPRPDLHAKLTAALASLDLTPEAELSYYRQQRQYESVPETDSAPDAASAVATPSADAPAEAPPEPETPSWVVITDPATSPVNPPVPAQVVDPINVPSVPQPDVETVVSSPTIIVPEPHSPPTPPQAAAPSPAQPDVSEADTTAIVPHATSELVATDELAMIEIDTDPDVEQDVPDDLAAQALPPSDFPQSYENYLDPSIEDYLESSEALLRHLEESTTPPDTKPKKTAKQTFTATVVSTNDAPTPTAPNQLRRFWMLLGLLVLFSLLGVGGWLFWRFNLGSRFRWGPASSPQPAPESTASPSETAPPTVTVDPLPTLSPSPAATSPSPTTPASPPTPSPAASPAPAASPSPTTPPTASASPTPAASPPPPPASTKFSLISEYKDPQSLADARKVVSTATEIKLGDRTVIQLGVRNSQAEAEAFQKELSDKGLNVEIVPRN